MNPLLMRVVNIESDQLEAQLDGLIPADWPISGDDLARYKAGVE